MIETLLANSSRILTECAVAERLRRMPEIDLHPTLFNSPLIYGPIAARDAMASIYREYLEIARLSGLPILLTAPTWRLDATRVEAAGVPASIVADAVSFLTARRDEVPLDQPPVAIGGLVGPKNDCYRPDLAPSTLEAVAFHRPQIQQLAATGIDFLLAQTMPSVAEAAGIAKAMSETGMAYVISFCTGTDGRVLDGTPLPEAMDRIDAMLPEGGRPLGYFVNCTHPRFILSACRPGDLSRLIGIQANGSSRDVTVLDGSAVTLTDPVEAWAASMLELHRKHEVPILGGCCGTGPAHLEALAVS
jgi:S-methylmethionine-dependent homocysteine/selenocysteine methylase